MEKIKKIDINLFDENFVSEKIYNEEKSKYIADYEEYVPGGFLSLGHSAKNPVVGEARWNKIYPNGYEDWAGKQRSLNSYGEQQVIDKINEIVDEINDLKVIKKY